jgi:hypothetical protein
VAEYLAFPAEHDDMNGAISIPLAGYTNNFVQGEHIVVMVLSFFWQQPCSISFGYRLVTCLDSLSAIKTVLEEKSASGNNLSLTCLEETFHNKKWINMSAAGSHCHWGEGKGVYMFSKLER